MSGTLWLPQLFSGTRGRGTGPSAQLPASHRLDGPRGPGLAQP